MVVPSADPFEIFSILINDSKATDNFIDRAEFDTQPTATFEFAGDVSGASASERIVAFWDAPGFRGRADRPLRRCAGSASTGYPCACRAASPGAATNGPRSKGPARSALGARAGSLEPLPLTAPCAPSSPFHAARPSGSRERAALTGGTASRRSARGGVDSNDIAC